MSIDLAAAWAPGPLLSTTHRTLLAVLDSPGAPAGDVARDLNVVAADVVTAMKILEDNALGSMQGSLAPPSSTFIVSAQGRATAERWRSTSAARRAAELDAAVLSWLEPYDGPGGAPSGDAFRTDVRSWIFGVRAEPREIKHALDRLRQKGLIEASSSAQVEYMRVWLTTTGREVLTDHDGNVRAWENRSATRGHIINAHGSVVAVDSPGATQTATITLNSATTQAVTEVLEVMRSLLAQVPPSALATETVEVLAEIQEEVTKGGDRNKLLLLAARITGKVNALVTAASLGAAGEAGKELGKHAMHLCQLLT